MNTNHYCILGHGLESDGSIGDNVTKTIQDKKRGSRGELGGSESLANPYLEAIIGCSSTDRAALLSENSSGGRYARAKVLLPPDNVHLS
jgi:hypothetical protein